MARTARQAHELNDPTARGSPEGRPPHGRAALPVPDAVAAYAEHVDFRVKTFADEAVKELDFLKSQYGFAGPEVERGGSRGTMVSVSYRRGDVTIEVSLVFWYMGDEYVATARVVDGRHGAVRRSELGHNTAHTGYQMRRALRLQAQAVRATIGAP
jgi:hypothetical protein